MEKAKTVKGPGNRRNMGPRPRLNNPLKTLSRLIKYMGKYYGIHMVIVVLCIIANVFASVNGTWFIEGISLTNIFYQWLKKAVMISDTS